MPEDLLDKLRLRAASPEEVNLSVWEITNPEFLSARPQDLERLLSQPQFRSATRSASRDGFLTRDEVAEMKIRELLRRIPDRLAQAAAADKARRAIVNKPGVNPATAEAPVDLGNKIKKIFEWRMVKDLSTVSVIHNIFGSDDYQLEDSLNEIWKQQASLGGWIAYQRYVKNNVKLSNEWQKIKFSNVDAEALTHHWEQDSHRLFDAGWWLHGSQGVHFSGTAEVRIHEGHAEIRNIDTVWTWHDYISAKGGSGTDLLLERAWHYTGEFILRTAFHVEIHWDDKEPQEQRLDVNK